MTPTHQSSLSTSAGFATSTPTIEKATNVFWGIVRRTRAMLGERLGRKWDPNRPIPTSEIWVYITALEFGESTLDGAERVATRTFECTAEQAAQAIARQTHKLASREEADNFLADRRRREKFCETENERLNPAYGVQRASAAATQALTEAARALTAHGRMDNGAAFAETTDASQQSKTPKPKG